MDGGQARLFFVALIEQSSSAPTARPRAERPRTAQRNRGSPRAAEPGTPGL
jgi:hypothetical protein